MTVYGIDAAALLKERPTGVENYVRALLGAMAEMPLEPHEQVRLYAPGPQPAWLNLPPGWTWCYLKFFLPLGWTQLRLSFELVFNGPTIFFSPAHEIPIFSGQAACVATVHDLAFLETTGAYSWFGRLRQLWAVRRVKTRASLVLAVSEYTKQALQRFLHLSAEKIIVTPEAPAVTVFSTPEKTAEVLTKYQLTKGQYIFFLGRIEDKKNLLVLIKVFQRLLNCSPELSHVKLVLGGADGFGAEGIRLAAAEGGHAEQIKFLGYVPKEDVPALYSGAKIFAFPSVAEGFGLPLLEAMSYGVPVIASDLAVFKEVAAEAAYFVSANDIEAWAAAIRELLVNDIKCQQLIERGQIRVKDFSWAVTAQQTWAALRSVRV